MEYNGGKFLPNFERSKLGPGAKIEKSDATFADLPIFFQSAKTIFFCGDSLKVKFDKAKSLFLTLYVSMVITTGHAYKSWVIFRFSRASQHKKIKKLRQNSLKGVLPPMLYEWSMTCACVCM